jgi:response regulator RpfG family c-di-GMP phosphodiesterase
MDIIWNGKVSHFDPSLVDLFMVKADEIHNAKKVGEQQRLLLRAIHI